jgi:uncharacterized protein YjdB
MLPTAISTFFRIIHGLRLRVSGLLATTFLLALTLIAGCGGRSDDGLLPADASTVPAESGSNIKDGSLADRAPDAQIGDGQVSDGQINEASTDGGQTVTLVSIAVTPPAPTLAIATKVTLTVTGTYSDKTTADLTQSAKLTSDTPAVATVAGNVVTAVAAGTATITASVNGLSAIAKITVTPATIQSIAVTPPTATTGVSGTVDFVALATLSDGSHQTITTTVAWSSSNMAVASVAASGRAQGLSAGDTTIRATFGGLVGSAQLHVTAATLVSIALTPTLPVYGTRVTFPFTAIATYSDASIADVTATAMWSSSDTTVVTITPAGVASTVAAGTSVVTATLNGVSGTTTVTVTAATLQSITVTPAMTTLAIAGTANLIATGLYSDMTTVDLTDSVTWTSSAVGVASVSNAAGTNGQVTALSAGMATITATQGVVNGTASVVVTAATLKSIAITPANPLVPINTNLALIAKGTYSDGSIVDITTTVTWSLADGTIATISNAAGSNGTAMGVKIGSTQVTATLDGVQGSTTITVTSAKLVSIAVTPANSSLVAGTKQPMQAIGTFSDMTTVDLTTTAVWTTGDANVATVSNASGAQGQLTAVGQGTTTVTATSSGVMGSTNVTVTSPAISQIVVTPINPTRPVGQRQQFTATAIFSNGTQRNVTGQAMWSSSNTGVATINGTGNATAVAAGTTTIQATYQGLSSTSAFTVSAAVVVSISVTPIAPTMPAGTVQQFQATAIFSDNTSQNVTGQSTWVSTNPAVAGVATNGFMRGRVSALTAGTADIQATYQGITGSTTVTVSSATLVSISVSPASISVVVGTTRQFNAAAIYSDGSSRDVTGMATWQSSAPMVASISTAGGTRGQAKSLSAGTATITASFGGLSGTATVTVTSATLVSIQLSPAAPTVAKGVPVRFTAAAIFSDNTSQDITGGSTWVSSAPMVAQVSDAGGSKGLTTTLSAGTATITATWMGSSGSTTITVTGATLTTIQITPFSPKLPVGFITPFVATGIYSDSTTLDLTGLATWSSSAPGTAAVSDSGGSKGRVTPLAAGSAKITATYQGVTGSDDVTVSGATLTSIAVTPASASIAVQGLQQFTATGTFSDMSTLDITNYVTWLSSVPATADISNAAGSQGQAKALKSGDVTITAVRGSAMSTASLHVQ